MSGLSPLARGTRTAQTGDQTDGAGLSPLARGTLQRRYTSCAAARFIPAGAGNSLNITYY
ncbi:hypothetical protein ECDEC5E_3431 [Escherichia coli DEC5E]|nr:hypothetical protein ECDEC5E_3431 [Escherichia coli DEC5E]